MAKKELRIRSTDQSLGSKKEIASDFTDDDEMSAFLWAAAYSSFCNYVMKPLQESKAHDNQIQKIIESVPKEEVDSLRHWRTADFVRNPRESNLIKHLVSFSRVPPKRTGELFGWIQKTNANEVYLGEFAKIIGSDSIDEKYDNRCSVASVGIHDQVSWGNHDIYLCRRIVPGDGRVFASLRVPGKNLNITDTKNDDLPEVYKYALNNSCGNFLDYQYPAPAFGPPPLGEADQMLRDWRTQGRLTEIQRLLGLK